MPRIEVRANHDDLVGFVRARDFGDDVEGIRIVVVVLILNVHLDLDGQVLVEQPINAVVLFDGNDHLWSYRWIRFVAASSTLDGHCATVMGAWLEERSNALIHPKLGSLRRESLIVAAASATLSAAAADG